MLVIYKIQAFFPDISMQVKLAGPLFMSLSITETLQKIYIASLKVRKGEKAHCIFDVRMRPALLIAMLTVLMIKF
jgi:hypothetical protein